MWRGDRQRGGPDMNRPGRWVDREGDDRTNASPADRADRQDRDGARDAQRWNGGNVQWDGRQIRDGAQRDPSRDGDRRWEGNRDGRRDGDRRWDDGRRDRDGDRRGWDGRWSRDDRDRWDRHDRDRDRRRGDRAYWSQGRYPFSYHSTRRYRGPAWIAPSGFYLRTWSYGDYLPWGWYGASYRLNDWWSYGLPWPPPGYDWVRNGPDVLLVDRFTGRIVQVVRMVFW
ncbi:RcnB family protein [Phenylobacterium sp. J426]|uniref:RcnB family protein n=1 Tax=Phenylobacterium sp. J426 TaxID=2898439 RepID=UPI002151E5DE|nr:RcnB family protein [Phenylobacterium sp. J426]MCR5874798.1 RcnB family protein [Phenylobacterium sp. J426]